MGPPLSGSALLSKAYHPIVHALPMARYGKRFSVFFLGCYSHGASIAGSAGDAIAGDRPDAPSDSPGQGRQARRGEDNAA